MTILAALNGYHRRLEAKGKAPGYGYASQPISYAIALTPDGEPVGVTPLIDTSGKKPRPRSLPVPRPEKRASNIAPNFLWDKTSYVLGVTATPSDRTAQLHDAFKALHEEALADTKDEGLAAFLAFLRRWAPDRFDAPPFTAEMCDANIVFRLDGELEFLHDRSAARTAWTRHLAAQSASEARCLVTGETAPVARLHPAIKGVYGAQTSGASIVSFNLDAFTSYGKEQGANAPVSEHAAAAYTTALNTLLARNSVNRVQIGDASTVFWAEAADVGEAAAEAAELLFAHVLAPPTDEGEAVRVGDVLDKMARGRPLKEINLKLEEGTRFYVLGLSPNAARLSIRFWHADTLGGLAERFREHWRDLWIEPTAWGRRPPSIHRLLYETAVQHKAENIPPLLGGALTRSILTGERYPRPLFTTLITRIRADRTINGLRAAMLKACLVRDARKEGKKEDVPVSLNREESNAGYRLGRLFAVLEGAQRAALGNINATIRDRYYGAASATPASVFPILLRTAGHHLSSMRKGDKGGLAHWMEQEIGQIVGGLGASLPRNLRIEDQGRFAIGYYHQRFAGREAAPEDASAATADATEDDSEA